MSLIDRILASLGIAMLSALAGSLVAELALGSASDYQGPAAIVIAAPLLWMIWGPSLGALVRSAKARVGGLLITAFMLFWMAAERGESRVTDAQLRLLAWTLLIVAGWLWWRERDRSRG